MHAFARLGETGCHEARRHKQFDTHDFSTTHGSFLRLFHNGPFGDAGLLQGPNIEKLSYGATYRFSSPESYFESCCGANFAEKDTWDLRREASVPRVVIEAHLSNLS